MFHNCRFLLIEMSQSDPNKFIHADYAKKNIAELLYGILHNKEAAAAKL